MKLFNIGIGLIVLSLIFIMFILSYKHSFEKYVNVDIMISILSIILSSTLTYFIYGLEKSKKGGFPNSINLSCNDLQYEYIKSNILTIIANAAIRLKKIEMINRDIKKEEYDDLFNWMIEYSKLWKTPIEQNNFRVDTFKKTFDIHSQFYSSDMAFIESGLNGDIDSILSVMFHGKPCALININNWNTITNCNLPWNPKKLFNSYIRIFDEMNKDKFLVLVSYKDEYNKPNIIEYNSTWTNTVVFASLDSLAIAHYLSIHLSPWSTIEQHVIYGLCLGYTKENIYEFIVHKNTKNAPTNDHKYYSQWKSDPNEFIDSYKKEINDFIKQWSPTIFLETFTRESPIAIQNIPTIQKFITY